MGKQAQKNIAVYLPILCLPLLIIQFVGVILLISGAVTLSISGFVVDNFDRIYVGTAKAISVYENGELVREINPKTSRTYRFTMDDNGNLVLSTSSKIYIMDLEGNILETKEDPGADAYNQISYRKNKFVSQKGDEYRLINFGRSKIVKNGTQTVYQMDVLSYLVKLSMVVCAVLLIIILLWGYINKNHKTGDGSLS